MNRRYFLLFRRPEYAGGGCVPWVARAVAAQDPFPSEASAPAHLGQVIRRLIELVFEGWFPVDYITDYVIADALEAGIPRSGRGHDD